MEIYFRSAVGINMAFFSIQCQILVQWVIMAARECASVLYERIFGFKLKFYIQNLKSLIRISLEASYS
jgi:hypothetical protein